MLSLLRRQIGLQVPRNARYLSGAGEASSSLASTSNSSPYPASTSISAPSSPTTKATAKLEYFVPRNTKGNLPVYTDVRNAGSRHLVLIRNVEGNLKALANDLEKSLLEFDPNVPPRLKIQINQSKHLVISGGRYKDDVMQFLKDKGF